METLTNYWMIALNFIDEHFTLIFAIIYWILMIYFQYKYYKEQRKNSTLKITNSKMKLKSSLSNFLEKLAQSVIWIQWEEIVKLNKEIKDLKNQKKTQKYYLEKRYLAFELATRFFLSKWAFNTLQRRYYLYNNKKLSDLEKIKKDLKKTNKNI